MSEQPFDPEDAGQTPQQPESEERRLQRGVLLQAIEYVQNGLQHSQVREIIVDPYVVLARYYPAIGKYSEEAVAPHLQSVLTASQAFLSRLGEYVDKGGVFIVDEFGGEVGSAVGRKAKFTLPGLGISVRSDVKQRQRTADMFGKIELDVPSIPGSIQMSHWFDSTSYEQNESVNIANSNQRIETSYFNLFSKGNPKSPDRSLRIPNLFSDYSATVQKNWDAGDAATILKNASTGIREATNRIPVMGKGK